MTCLCRCVVEVYINRLALTVASRHGDIAGTAIRIIGDLVRRVIDDDAVDIPTDLIALSVYIISKPSFNYIPLDVLSFGVVANLVVRMRSVVVSNLPLNILIRRHACQVFLNKFGIIVNCDRLLQRTLKLSAIVFRKITTIITGRFKRLLAVSANVEICSQDVSVRAFTVVPDSIKRYVFRKGSVVA